MSTLREMVEADSESPQFRISAARSLLEYSLKLTEQNDIIAKLQELEKAMADRQNGRR